MTFKKAVLATPSVQQAYRPGLQALSPGDAKRIQAENPRRLTGSLNLDAALQAAQPDAPRWDYGIGYRRSDREEAFWVEVHPASSDNVSEVLEKLAWLRKWLKNEASSLQELTRGGFYWVATGGSVAITRHSRQARQLAKAGLRGPWRVLSLPARDSRARARSRLPGRA